MTILPAKRTASAAEESADSAAPNGTTERSVRRREEHSIPHASNDSTIAVNRRTQYRCGASTPEPNLRKRFKESKFSRRKQRERERERERKTTNRSESAEQNLTDDTVHNATNSESTLSEPSCSTRDNELPPDPEEGTGFNSEDEYTSLRPFKNLTEEEWTARDTLFSRCLFSELGFEIKQMNEDGACLFRAIADQIFGDQDLHYMVRSSCMDYIVKNKDFFTAYVTEDFDKYVARKRKWNVHGNHLEIQALSEMYNRTIEVYCYQIQPINIFNGTSLNSDEPIRLSYHRMCHYNSISNPNKPSVLVGLGLPSYHTIDLNRRRLIDAVRASDELLIEQTMLEDKLKATDWEATNEALEEEVARESYIQFFRDAERRLKPQGHPLAAGSSSTITSNVCSSPRASRRGSLSPKGSMSPKGGSSPKYCGPSTRSSPRISTPVSDFTAGYEGSSAITFPAPEASVSTHFAEAPMKATSANSSPKASNGFNSFDFAASYSGYSNLSASTSRNETHAPELQSSSSTCTTTKLDFVDEENWEKSVMAQVLEESRRTYLEDLKRKRLGSPGPSTSS